MPNKQYAAPAWAQDIEDYKHYLTAAGYRAESVKTRSRQLVRLSLDLRDISPRNVTPRDLLAWFESKSWSAETRRSARDAVRLFFAWLVQMGARDDNPAEILPKVRRTSPCPHPCPDDLIADAIVRATPEVRMMLRLGAECGLRRSEIAKVAAGDVLDAPDGYSLIVHGKGGKQRIVPMPDDLAEEIIRAGGYVFPGRFGGCVEASYIGKRVGRMLPKGWSCHSLRHRYATKLYAATMDIMLVSRLLGHESVVTTQRYVALPAVRLRDAVASVAVS